MKPYKWSSREAFAEKINILVNNALSHLRSLEARATKKMVRELEINVNDADFVWESKRGFVYDVNLMTKASWEEVFFYSDLNKNKNNNKRIKFGMTRSESRTNNLKIHRSLTLVEILISLSLLYGQCGQSMAQPWMGPPIESAECLINWPMWELKW